MLLPTAAKAESYWLILKHNGMVKIEMPNIQQCESEGERYYRQRSKQGGSGKDWFCITGK